MRPVLPLAVIALAILVAGCGSGNGNGNGNGNGTGGEDGSGEGAGTLTVRLEEQNASGQSGKASLAELEKSTTQVVIVVSNPPLGTQPAHIHKGSCANLDPQPAYPLQNLVSGTSNSDVPVSLDELQDGEFAINVHKSEAEVETYVACGDIGSGTGETETDEDEPGTTTDYGY
jgi:hypothetical protein